jgi:flagellar hook-associated protein 2
MSGISFSGLGSGIDTATIVRQLMALEARPKNALVAQRSKLNVADQAFGALKTKIGALRTSAQALGLSTGWQSVKATSSDDTRLGVSATSSASQGSFTFVVEQLASRNTTASFFNVADRGTTNITNGSTSITVATSGGSTSVNVGAGTLDEVVSAINGQSTVKARASAVQVSPGQWKLQIEATDPSETLATSDTQFSLGPFATVSNGQQARIRVGGAAGYEVYSNSNTFTDLMPGITVTAKAVSAVPVSVEVNPDTGALADKVQAFVDSYNAAQADLKTQSKYDTTTKVAGPLNGQASVRSAAAGLADTVLGSAATNLGSIGISIDKSGVLSLDKAKFQAAYNTNPAATQALFTDPVTGMAKRMADRVNSLIDLTDGIVTSGQDTVKRQVKDLDDRIAQYEVRLAKREETLRRQFLSMDTRVGTLRAQFGQFSSQLGIG